MKCLRCRDFTHVTTTYQNENGVTRRRRQCLKCGFRFTTRETPDLKDVERAKKPDPIKQEKRSSGVDLQRTWFKKSK